MATLRESKAKSFIARTLIQILSILSPKAEKKGPIAKNGNMSNDSNLEEKPLSYHHYWMVYIKKVLDQTIPDFQKKISNYKTFLNSVSGALLIGGIAWTTYVDTTNWKIFLLIFGPIVGLQLARLFVDVVFDRTDVININDITDSTQVHTAHNTRVLAMSQKATLAKIAVFIATVIFLFCVPYGIFLHNLESKKEVPSSYLNVTAESNTLSINGSLKDAEKVSAVLYGVNSKKEVAPPIYTDFILKEKGTLNATLDLKVLGISLDSLDLTYKTSQGHVRNTFRFSSKK